MKSPEEWIKDEYYDEDTGDILHYDVYEVMKLYTIYCFDCVTPSAEDIQDAAINSFTDKSVNKNSMWKQIGFIRGVGWLMRRIISITNTIKPDSTF